MQSYSSTSMCTMQAHGGMMWCHQRAFPNVPKGLAFPTLWTCCHAHSFFFRLDLHSAAAFWADVPCSWHLQLPESSTAVWFHVHCFLLHFLRAPSRHSDPFILHCLALQSFLKCPSNSYILYTCKTSVMQMMPRLLPAWVVVDTPRMMAVMQTQSFPLLGNWTPGNISLGGHEWAGCPGTLFSKKGL